MKNNSGRAISITVCGYLLQRRPGYLSLESMQEGELQRDIKHSVNSTSSTNSFNKSMKFSCC